jgi:two-component system, response regulator, stage 0 sporulation protein F
MSDPVTTPAIILVDDDPDLLLMMRRLLRSLSTDYQILMCTRADTALDQARQQPTPLVITDYNLSGMNGLQLTATLKGHAPTTRVILITGYAIGDLDRRARERGVDCVLQKPFQPDTFIQAVQASLRA